MASPSSLSSLLRPKSIALIGASRTPGKLGYDILGNILHLGYTGVVFPINPKASEIMGIPAYTSISHVPEIPDCVVIAIPAKFVNEAVEECGEKGVTNIVIISAGFKETDQEGAEREHQLQEIIQRYNISLIGPNCLGIINPHISLNASFGEGMPNPGKTALVSQSGAMAVAIIDWAYESGIGFSKIISMGNKAGEDEVSLLKFLGDDPETEVILMYLESITQGRAFFDLAKEISLKKPIIIVKSGTSPAGTQAISSHTGSLAGSDDVINTAFRQAGIIRAHTIEEMFDYAKVFSSAQPPKGNRVGIVTNAGGPGIMTTDALEDSDLELATLSPVLQKELAVHLPETAALHNPVDVIGDALSERYQHALSTLLSSDDIDILLVVLTPQVMTEVKKTAEMITALAYEYPEKTIISVFIGGESIRRGDAIFRRHHFPQFCFPSRAVRSVNALYQYQSWKKKQECQKKLKNQQRLWKKPDFSLTSSPGEKLSPADILSLTTHYDIPAPLIHIAKTPEEAMTHAQTCGFPVVMKVVSPDIYHKTDAGGVRIDIQSTQEVASAWSEIQNNVATHAPDADIEGISIERMTPSGKEIIIGAKKDPSFGHLIMFGMGGIYVEIMKDVAFRLAPCTTDIAKDMISEIKAYPLLLGVRGEKTVNIDRIAEIVSAVSTLVTDFPEIQEFEINPLIVRTDGGVSAVDVNGAIDKTNKNTDS